jgi:hypothetical protein
MDNTYTLALAIFCVDTCHARGLSMMIRNFPLWEIAAFLQTLPFTRVYEEHPSKPEMPSLFLCVSRLKEVWCSWIKTKDNALVTPD